MKNAITEETISRYVRILKDEPPLIFASTLDCSKLGMNNGILPILMINNKKAPNPIINNTLSKKIE